MAAQPVHGSGDPEPQTRPEQLDSAAIRGARIPQDDIDARRWRAAVEERLFGQPSRRQAMGRYTILRKLGEGAHGVVYEAFDPELERAVALKLVRIGGSDADGAEERMLREARALARLKDPHVVAVHDAGRDSAGIFIAMELVDGVTLRQWMASESPHGIDRIIEVFGQAAHGLAAAHRAGLVHRDFKPENVLVGGDGRVRVSDFGLAQIPASALPGEEARRDPRTRTIAGTPAYMAPEQREGRSADHRSDQFSFCVALLEALRGRRPDLDRLETEIDRNDGQRIPRWLKRILRRGLCPDPPSRFDDMNALLRALDRGRQRAGRRRTASVLIVIILCALALVIALRDDVEPLCDPAEAASLWPPETTERVRQAFAQSGVTEATETWRLVDELARARIEEWRALAEGVCTGTEARERARALCLGWQLHELRAFEAVMAAADARAVEHAIAAVHALPDPSRCMAAEWDLATESNNRAAPESVERVHAAVADATVRFEAGQLGEALHASSGALVLAQELGSRPLEAEALLVRGRAAAALHGSEEAAGLDPETLLYAALLAADAGRHPIAVTGALVELTSWAISQRRFETAEMWSARALQTLAQMPGERRLAARLYWNLSIADAWQNRLEDAHAKLERAMELLGNERSNPLLWRFLNHRGEIAYAQADYPRARRAYEESLDLITAHLGRDHLWIADAHGNLGEVATAEHRLDEALRHFEVALRIRRQVLGDDSYWVMHTMAHFGDVLYRAGDLERARTSYEVVLDGPKGDDPAGCDREIWARNGLALVALERSDVHEALRIAESTRGVSPKGDPSHLDLCDRLDVYALALIANGQPDAALEYLEEVAPKLEASAGPEHRAMMPLLVAEAEALHALGRVDEARIKVERARAIHERDGANPPTLAERVNHLLSTP